MNVLFRHFIVYDYYLVKYAIIKCIQNMFAILKKRRKTSLKEIPTAAV